MRDPMTRGAQHSQIAYHRFSRAHTNRVRVVRVEQPPRCVRESARVARDTPVVTPGIKALRRSRQRWVSFRYKRCPITTLAFFGTELRVCQSFEVARTQMLITLNISQVLLKSFAIR